MTKCTLPKELNTCQYFADNSEGLKPPPYPCGMIEQPLVHKNTYVRKERWYEKYYKGSK